MKIEPGPSLRTLLLLFALALCFRTLAQHREGWYEGDDTCIAAGVAALVQGNDGPAYRYGPQVGYYRLVEGIARLPFLGVDAIPDIMLLLSALAGALLPVLALLAFPNDLGRSTRTITSLLLLTNPLLFVTSQYGNTALVSCAFAFASITWLSRKPGFLSELAALLLFGAGTLVRADAILLTPLITWLVFRNGGFTLRGSLNGLLVAGTMFGIYLALFRFDPRMAEFADTVNEHVVNEKYSTRFFDYLLWSFSPIPLLFACSAMRELLEEKRELLKLLIFWCVPIFGFYFSATTTPRYFVLTLYPICLATAVGVIKLHASLGSSAPRLSKTLLALLCSLHLFIGLGHFVAGKKYGIIRDAQFLTHDGSMPTGGLLYIAARNAYHTWQQPGFFQSQRRASFDREMRAHLKTWSEGGGPRSLVFVLGHFPTVAFYYHAQCARAEFITPMLGSEPFGRGACLRIGETKIYGIANWMNDLQNLEGTLPLDPGDLLWRADATDMPHILSKLPSGIKLEPALDREPIAGITAYRALPITADHP